MLPFCQTRLQEVTETVSLWRGVGKPKIYRELSPYKGPVIFSPVSYPREKAKIG